MAVFANLNENRLDVLLERRCNGFGGFVIGWSWRRGVVRSALASAHTGADAIATPAAVSGALESVLSAAGTTLKAMLLAT